MARPAPNYAIVFLMFAVSAAATCWLMSRPDAALFTPHLSSFPRQISHWRDEDIPLDSETRQALKADEVICRGYQSSTGEDPQMLLVVYRKYGRREFAHLPEACYPAAGWEIVSKRYTRVPYAGRNVRAVKVVAVKGDAREIIIYWFASGRQTEANYIKQQFEMAFDRLRTRKYGWAFIRVNSRVTDSDEATLADTRHFLRNASRPLADTLTGTSNGARVREASSRGGGEP